MSETTADNAVTDAKADATGSLNRGNSIECVYGRQIGRLRLTRAPQQQLVMDTGDGSPGWRPTMYALRTTLT
jgi:hypothetical protein